jgi:type I restriction enzyme S subunit
MTNSNSNYSDLPPGWKIVQLQDIGKIVSGGTPSTKVAEYWEEEICWISPADLSGYNQKYISKGNKSISKFGLENSSAKLMPKGSILFSSRAPIGYVAIASNSLATNQGFKSIIPNENIFNEYIYYYLKSAKQLAEKHANGTTFKEISAKAFASLSIPLPPLPEQHRIVEKIEELFSELDDGVASLKKALEQLKTYRQAVLKWAFEGKLTEKWRNTHQDSLEDADTLLEQIKAERKRHYQQQLEDWKQALKEWENNGKETKKPTAPRKQEYYSPLKQEETNKLWKIPDKWTWEKVGNICQSIVPNRDKPKSFSGNIPWITTPDIDSDLITLKLLPNHLGLNINEVELYNARVIPKNSVIMTCVGSFGIVCINTISCVINQQLHAFMTHSYINNKYLAYALKIQQSWMEKKSTSTTVVYLNKTNSNSVPIPLCSLQEQTKIVQEIESRLSICDQLEATLTENLDKAEALRQSILKRAFEGKLVL